MSSRDTANFTSPSAHRLPTVSASQALKDLTTTGHLGLSTGLQQLDSLLLGRRAVFGKEDQRIGGLQRGHVTEIYGPPGVGKTAMAIQAVACALRSRHSVVWIDTAHNLPGSRLKCVLQNYKPPGSDEPPFRPTEQSVDELLGRFHHYNTPTLPHLLALLAYQSVSFPPPNTSLIVIDTITSFFATAFPRAAVNHDRNTTSTAKKGSEAVTWAASRRWTVIADIAACMSKFAATTRTSVLLLSQTTTKVHFGAGAGGAVLRPAISTKAWDDGIGNRILIFRDWLGPSQIAGDDPGVNVGRLRKSGGVRFATVVRVGGTAVDGTGSVVPFTIAKHGLVPVVLLPHPPDQQPIQLPFMPTPVPSLSARKRKRNDQLEIADSDDELEFDDGMWMDQEEELDLLASAVVATETGDLEEGLEEEEGEKKEEDVGIEDAWIRGKGGP